MPLSTRELLDSLPQQGALRWIGLRPARKAPMNSVDVVDVIEAQGLFGDRAVKGPRLRPGKRQVTFFQHEHLAVLEALLGRPVHPELLRRNLVVSGINLHALKGRRFRVGDALFEHTGLCDPCHRMEENLGPGGFNAMRMHCGITTRVLQGGTIRLGDAVVLER